MWIPACYKWTHSESGYWDSKHFIGDTQGFIRINGDPESWRNRVSLRKAQRMKATIFEEKSSREKGVSKPWGSVFGAANTGVAERWPAEANMKHWSSPCGESPGLQSKPRRWLLFLLILPGSHVWKTAEKRVRCLEMGKRRWDHSYIFWQEVKTKVSWVWGPTEWSCVLICPAES